MKVESVVVRFQAVTSWVEAKNGFRVQIRATHGVRAEKTCPELAMGAGIIPMHD
jgi:hypothetical protein